MFGFVCRFNLCTIYVKEKKFVESSQTDLLRLGTVPKFLVRTMYFYNIKSQLISLKAQTKILKIWVDSIG